MPIITPSRLFTKSLNSDLIGVDREAHLCIVNATFWLSSTSVTHTLKNGHCVQVEELHYNSCVQWQPYKTLRVYDSLSPWAEGSFSWWIKQVSPATDWSSSNKLVKSQSERKLERSARRSRSRFRTHRYLKCTFGPGHRFSAQGRTDLTG